MKKTKKLLCLFLAMVILIPNIAIFSNAVDAEQAEVSEPLLIEVTTDKSSYTAYGIAGITVKVTNTSDEVINNISAEAVFEQLAPVGKNNETFKDVETLQPNESFEFSYKATVNSSKVKINFFAKIFLWFTRLFNGGYTATSHDIEADIENVTEINFGKYTVQNVVRVSYEKKTITDEQFESADETINILNNIAKPYTDDNGYIDIDKRDELLQIISVELEKYKDKEIVREYYIGEDSATIIFDGNITYIYTPAVERELSGSGASEIITIEVFDTWDIIISGNEQLSAELDAWANNFGYGLGLSDNVEFITKENTNYVYKEGIKKSQFTIEKLKNLANYKIMILEGHGAWNSKDNYCCICTGESVTKESRQRYAEEIANNEIVITSGTLQKSTYAVTPAFLNKHLKYNENSLVFLENCYSLKNEKLANVFMNKGAYCVIGYDDATDISYGKLTRSYFFRYATQRDDNGKYPTIDSAVNKIKNQFSEYLKSCKSTGELTVLFNEKVSGSSKTLFGEIPDNSSGGDTGAEKASVHGMVKDEKTGNAISGVRVEFIDNSTDNYDTVATATTGADGSFSVELPYGSYSMSFNHDDYEYYGASIDVDTEMVVLTEPVLLTPKNSGDGDDDSGETDEPVITVVNSGDCGADGSNVTWTLYSDGTLVISGNGAMANYNIAFKENYPWYEVRTNIKTVKINNGVTNIGNGAFEYCRELTSITIPNSVTSIGIGTFRDCTYLSSINLPNSVTHIGNSAFGYCTNLTEIIIPDSVTSIDNYAFSFCRDLTTVTLSKNITSIGNGTFYGCTSLKNVIVPNNVTSLGNDAFYGCTSLENIIVPDGVTSIGSGAFYGCSSLTNITIPNSITSIGSESFKNTGYYNDLNNWENNILYIDNVLICANKKANGDITIKYGTTIIAEYAFSECTNIIHISIPNSMTTINSEAFRGCVGLVSVIISNSVTDIEAYAFEDCNSLKEIKIPVSAKIQRSSFDGCSNIEKVTLTKGTGTMQDYNYLIPSSYQYTPWYISRNSMKEIIIEEGIKNIGSYAFCESSNITSIIIPNGVTSIGECAFRDCTSLRTVTLPNSITNIEYGTFWGCNNLSCISIPDSVIKIGTYAFKDCASISNIVIPHSVTNIGNSAFQGCTNLISITIPNSVTNIGNYAFSDCSNLTSVSIPNSATNIGNNTFSNCVSLTNIIIPNSINSIGNDTFNGCTSLTSITIPNSITSIGYSAFENCPNLSDVYYSGSKKEWDDISLILDYANKHNNSDLLSATIHYNSKI